MKIVIKLSDTLMEYIVKGRDLSEEQNNEMALAIANGTPLPKGHGDLIDRNELLDESYQIDSMYCMYDEVVKVDDIKNAPTIIEGSDKE